MQEEVWIIVLLIVLSIFAPKGKASGGVHRCTVKQKSEKEEEQEQNQRVKEILCQKGYEHHKDSAGTEYYTNIPGVSFPVVVLNKKEIVEHCEGKRKPKLRIPLIVEPYKSEIE